MKFPHLFTAICFYAALHVCCGSPIEELTHTDIPFVGDRASGVSIDGSGRKLVINYTSSATEITIQKDEKSIGSLKLHKNISIYNVQWFEGLPWFALREKANSGNATHLVAIVEFRDSEKNGEFIYYTQTVSSENTSGRIFELVDVDREKVTVISRFHHPKSQKIAYLKGFIFRSKLEKIDIARILMNDKLPAEPLPPESEILIEERIPASRVD